jgi:hypothetical protein
VRVRRRLKRLESNDYPRGASRHDIARPLGGADAGIDPDRDVRPLSGDRGAEHALEHSAHDGIEVGEVEFANAEPVADGAHYRQRITWSGWRELRRKWRVAVAMSTPCMHRLPTQNVQNRNYAHVKRMGEYRVRNSSELYIMLLTVIPLRGWGNRHRVRSDRGVSIVPLSTI